MAEVVFAALYLEGAPRGLAIPKARWRLVLGHLREASPTLGGASRALRRAGLVEESILLDEPRLLDWAERRVCAGVVLTAASQGYPGPWRARLGAQAPPALWLRGPMPQGPFLAIVGSRNVSGPIRRFASACGQEAARLGFTVVSGGACGCDRAAARGAAAARPEGVVEILPCGMDRRRERFPGTALSPFAPEAEFCAAQAMMRNTLIYALGEAALLVHARLGEGGTWKGAIAAHRRRLAPLLVRAGAGRAAQALCGLGAVPLAAPDGLSEALVRARAGGLQACLALNP